MSREPLAFAHMSDSDEVLLDCQRHLKSWFGVVKVRDRLQTRIVHVCTPLRASFESALEDARREAQNLAPMFAQ